MANSKTKFVYQCQGCGYEIDEDDWNEDDDYDCCCSYRLVWNYDEGYEYHPSNFLLVPYSDPDNEGKTPDYEYDSYDCDE